MHAEWSATDKWWPAMKTSNMKIGTRLGLSFFVVILFTTVLSFVAWRELCAVSDKWVEFSHVSLEKRRLANNGTAKLGDAIHHFKDYVLRGKDYDKLFSDDLAEINSDVGNYMKVGVITSPEKLSLDEVLKGADDYRLAMQNAVAMKAAGKSIEEIDNSVTGADKKIARGWNDLLEVARQEANSTGKSIADTVSFAEKMTVIFASAVVILSVLCAWLATISITRPISHAVKIAQSVASGNLSNQIEVNSADETGLLLQALKEMNDSLQAIVTQVRTGTDSIASASSQIASGNLSLSSRTEEQACSLEETAASMQELTSAVQQNTSNARHACQLAVSASDIAVKGGGVVAQVVDTMGSINDSSKKIVDIISVIDSIAFQTNILALNAAVEAAHAGEHGRGFAVVATEVRNLASRSAVAAKEIKSLINESVAKVESGSRLVDQAGITMSDVVTSVNRVTEMINKITEATNEQTSGIEQINQAIMQMDDVTQQNAALVEEAAAAAQSLEDQAKNLVKVVSIFKLDALLPAACTGSKVASRLKETTSTLLSASRKANPLALNIKTV